MDHTAEPEREILNRCPNVIYIYDLIEQRNLYANLEIGSVLGYSVAEIQDMGSELFLRIMYPEDLQRTVEHQQRIAAAQDGEVCEFEYRMRHKDGTWRWLVSRDTPYRRAAEGSVVAYLGVVMDVTEKKYALDWAQQVLNKMPNIVYVFDAHEQRNIYTNGQIGELLGYSLEEIQAMGDALLPTIMHPEDLLAFPGMEQQIAAADDEDIIVLEYRMKRPDGTWVWLQDSVRVFVRTLEGKVKQWMGAVQDITERKQADAERESLQLQIIEAQRATLRELSTPLIPITEGVVAMPMIGAIDTQRSQQMMETLLEGVVQYQATTVIVDVTGVQTVDSQVANALLQTAQAVRLLGAEVVLTGIQPQIAQTMIQLGIDMRGIITHSTLQSGIAAVLRQHQQMPEKFSSTYR
ncbi:MAG: PAS domain-containing protein [Chloroflexaceae bacterium]|nr:PAS domain-containing protein [Chloroflexaceae bacterium]